MTRDPATLHGREARAFLAARQAIDIGKHQRTFTRPDFVRVVLRYFAGNAHLRAIANANQRADRAEADNRRHLERIGQLEHELLRHTAVPIDDLPPRRVVELNRSEFEAFALFCEGTPRTAIAEELGLAPGTVSNYVSHVADLIDADAARAAALVNRNVVQLKVKPRRAAA